jgi:nucleotide-binding universal stress UspA family protein
VLRFSGTDARPLAAKGGEVSPAGEDEVRAEINQQAKELSERGIETQVELADTVLGGPAPAIVEIADRTGGDLIVAGRRGHSSLAGIVLGSVTHRLLHIASRSDRSWPFSPRRPISAGDGRN